ncbi:N-acetylmuramoyl-L-alanine amidase [Glycomyces sp. A-F 0318]|uniref:N-acetylmuramoyl-L-alanine amidase n=1 Tax=Glycomyces amatae TaxID=2881355 RepID=UPI001E333410|nr:peptidoglycan recognition family protein [Glycomyces amatae]MCD0442862.1 N-acetylmuramoyl-L-alanine amidase [Glycomyces amatae]
MTDHPHRRRRYRAVAAGAAALAAAAALGATAGHAGAETPAASPRQAEYAAAAAAYDVPEAILLGVSYLQSRWTDHGGEPSTAGGFGPMHLTDEVAAPSGAGPHHDGDPRGDDTRPMELLPEEDPAPETASGPTTVDDAADLTGETEDALRTDPAANIAGGAALLADHQAGLGVDSDDPADWYAAVARYSGAEDEATAARFADEVFEVVATGAAEDTDDGPVTLPATPVDHDRAQIALLDLPAPEGRHRTVCPRHLGCEWIPAPYERTGDLPGQYGNHDLANREEEIDVNAIVIHNTEGSYEGTLDVVRDPAQISWNYTVRSADGHIAEHLDHENVGWQAGNWAVNMRSLGIEHEGYAADGSWFTEILYRNSAELVGFLADRYDVPLDRAHILGHDNVPQSDHWDPGPYWDWEHYFHLLGADIDRPEGGVDSGVVTIAPDFERNHPVMTRCDTERPEAECPERNASTVFLYSEPSFDAPLLVDRVIDPDLGPATTRVDDTGSRAGYGQQYVVAGHQGDWTAVWYLGQTGWIHNPADNPVLAPAEGRTVTPLRDDVPVYRDTYPEEEAYEGTDAVYRENVVQYTIDTGQSYVFAQELRSQVLWAKTYEGPNFVVDGETVFYQIQIGHRIGYVNAADVALSDA